MPCDQICDTCRHLIEESAEGITFSITAEELEGLTDLAEAIAWQLECEAGMVVDDCDDEGSNDWRARKQGLVTLCLVLHRIRVALGER